MSEATSRRTFLGRLAGAGGAVATLLVAACRRRPGPEEAAEPRADTRVADAAGSAGLIQRIAFGSCAFQWEPQPIWEAIAVAEPDLFLFLGDAIYGDFDGERAYDATPESLRREWQVLADNRDFAAFRDRVPILSTWDNHDYGRHDGGAEFALKDASKEIFLDFFSEPADSERRTQRGIYTSRIFGPPGRRVQIILLDTRYNRGPALRDQRTTEERASVGLTGSLGSHLPNEDPEVTLLGPDQWGWLKRELQWAAEVRLIVSSTQIVPDQKGMDEWGNYPLERRRLFELIDLTAAEGVVVLSGNVHFAEASRTEEGPYPLYDFTSSGLTHTEAAYAEAENPYRVAGPFAGLNFGLVEIDWQASPAATIRFEARDVTGATVFDHGVSLGDLRTG